MISAGYRDYQGLVQAPGGWMMELQLMPAECYEVKKKCHDECSECRFILECAQRARKNAASKQAAIVTKPAPCSGADGPVYATATGASSSDEEDMAV